METIYSRKRILLPKITFASWNKKRPQKKKITKILTIIFIAILTACLILSHFTPAFHAICYAKAKAMATDILNQESNRVLKEIDYEDLVNIIRDNER